MATEGTLPLLGWVLFPAPYLGTRPGPEAGPVQGNNATVFLMAEGRPKDEEGETCTEKGKDGVGGYVHGCGVSQRSLVGGWGRVPGSPETGGAQTQGSPSLESESLAHSSKRGLGEIKGGTS